MTRTVIATFPDGEAARRAAVALGRTELAAGPTRVQVLASTSSPSARLELRVDEQDRPRAVALLRDHGADVKDSATGDTAPEACGGDSSDRSGSSEQSKQGEQKSPGLLAAWGTAVAEAVTAPMAGVSASDTQMRDRNAASPRPRRLEAVHASAAGGSQDEDRPPTGTGHVIMGNAPNRSRAGTGSGAHLSDTVAAGTASSMGQISDGPDGASSREAAMGASEGRLGPGTPNRLLDPTGSRERKDTLPSPDPTSRVRKGRKEG
jgi:hypothetical protein